MKPVVIVHFKDVDWLYHANPGTPHPEDKHAIRTLFKRTTKHKPPRQMYQIFFPGTENPINVYVTMEPIDGTMHYRCTPVNKKTDRLPPHLRGRGPVTLPIPPEVDKYGTPLNLSQ